MKLKQMLIFTAMFTFSGLTVACPDGYYAGEGADSNSCYPIPGEERQRGEIDEDKPSQPQQPQQKWEDTWGAIAIGDAKNGAGVMGAVTGMVSKRQASKAAIAECQAKGGGKSCNISITYYNQCAVVTWGDTGNNATHAATVEIATEMSMKSCSAKYANCSLYYWGCSPAKRVF